MHKKVIVISLGGSLIIPNEIDVKFLREFKKVIKKNSINYKFVIVCGGGIVARKYIHALSQVKISEKLQNFSGISATRSNARFMAYFFDQENQEGIPQRMKDVEKYLRKQDIVFCGALEYQPHQTSDGSATEIASHFNSDFINLTDIQGLYDKNPKKFKNAKFIPTISRTEFYEMASKLKFKPGQHFVLDQTAARLIMEKRIKTYLLGKDLKQLDNFLNHKDFVGTSIY